MDAATTAAVLAIVADESQEAALRDLLLERERLAMTLADRDSFLAQRHHVISAQLSSNRLITWQVAYDHRHNDYVDGQDTMRAALRALQRGDPEAAEQHLLAAVGSEQSVEDVEDDAEVEP